MFTGIVEEIGKVLRIDRKVKSFTIHIQAKRILEDVQLGDSIAVNGVCLTVTEFSRSSFQADVMPETFHATSLRMLSPGSMVNLERAMAANGRFGGHFVSGHVDGTGSLLSKKRVENALYMTFQIPEEFKVFVVEKGSIAIDGTSLTIFEASGGKITISLVPHTQAETVLANKNIGDSVNIEFDMLGKYIYHMLESRKEVKTEITMDKLIENGFIG
ncbi:riboflavin synthase subunit alpha [Siminovitchia terrae]|uniref:Riboflavin synthase n=1 Tax=Siminovitchia terrae TaxID=1914933 RepID=A0ABQ4L3I5_SIMTE|nr:riboflavin synthase [Siminovitchia terrae]GIN93152.1 riboflavin synthase subunit alpha [Siminovitchia terrae]GIN98439.1 riboflavin synthase subunit alpha [Siminovitchia terrae]